jgi:hypothetical protein
MKCGGRVVPHDFAGRIETPLRSTPMVDTNHQLFLSLEPPVVD